MRKLQEEKETKNNSKRKLFLRSLFAVVFVMLGTQIIISNLISTTGDKLSQFEQRYLILVSQNEAIKQEIATMASLNTLQKEAENLGFVKNTQVLYLQNAVNLSMKP